MAQTGDEEYIELPEKFGDYSMGFSIDGGGSVLKLIYRAKGQKSNNGKIRLMLRTFPVDGAEELMTFVQENCDTRKCDNTTAVHTGVRIQHFDEKLVSRFGSLGSQIKVASEFEAAATAITTICKVCPEDEVFYPPSRPAMEDMLKGLQQFAPMITKMKEADPESSVTSKMSDEASQKQTEVMTGLVALLQNPDPEILVANYTRGSSIFPCLYVIGGSAFTSMMFHEDKSSAMGELCPIGGRTLLGLGKVMCGAKSYDELVVMAQKGDPNKVDILSGELKAEKKKEDMYGVMPEDIPVFFMGKLHEVKYDGTYDKNDLAAGLIHALTFNIAHTSILNARIKKIKSIVMTGAFFRHEYVRDMVFKSFVKDAMWLPDDEKPVLRIVRNPGHIIAAGSYLIGWEAEASARSGNNNQDK